MRITIEKFAYWTFLAVLAYLVLVHNQGAKGLLGGIFGGWIGVTEALQGRSRPGGGGGRVNPRRQGRR